MVREDYYPDADDVYKARDNLKTLIIDFTEILHLIIEDKEIPASDLFEEKTLNQLLNDALAQLQINNSDRDIKNKILLGAILFEIDNLDEKSLKSIGMIGPNHNLKIYVYRTVAKEFERSIKASKETPGKKSLKDKIKSFFGWKDTADSILKSLAKFIPLFEPVIEFKDIYSHTRKTLDEVNNT